MVIYYDSKTGNVERFVDKIKNITDWIFIKVSDDILPLEKGHLITFTTQIGKVPVTTSHFIHYWHPYILSVSSSGNMNWGINYAKAADIISDEFQIPTLMKFELSGLNKDVKLFIEKVNNYANKEMDTPQ